MVVEKSLGFYISPIKLTTILIALSIVVQVVIIQGTLEADEPHDISIEPFKITNANSVRKVSLIPRNSPSKVNQCSRF